jgi:hypothetical protein
MRRQGPDGLPGRVGMRLLLGAGAVALAVATLEGSVRLLGLKAPGVYSNIRYESTPERGPWALPSQRVFFESSCFSVPDIHINRFGMRDREWELEASGRRIALVGDSMTQGLQVADTQTVSRRLEALMDPPGEAMNFGVSSTGTSGQLLLYRRLVRRFRPDVVVLMFFAKNDVTDNHPTLKRRFDPYMAEVSPYLVLDEAGWLKEEPLPGRWRRTSPLIGLATSWELGRWMLHWRRTHPASDRAVPGQRAAVVEAAQSKRDATQPAGEAALYDEAWGVTEAVLLQFRDEVKADGGRFAVAVIPSEMATLGRTGRVNRQTLTAVRRLRSVGQRAGFPVLDLSARYRTLVQREGPVALVPPCDFHWNARGHTETAAFLWEFLTELRWRS